MKSVVVDRMRLVTILKSARETQRNADNEAIHEWTLQLMEKLRSLHDEISLKIGSPTAALRKISDSIGHSLLDPEDLVDIVENDWTADIALIKMKIGHLNNYQTLQPPKPTYTKYDSVIRMCLASEAKTITLTHEEAEKYLNEELNSNGQPEQD